MKTSRRLNVGGRVPGEMVLDALRESVSTQGYRRKWSLFVDDNHQVTIRCFCSGKGKDGQIDPRIRIRIAEPVILSDMFLFITAEMVTEGARALLSRRYLMEDFDKIDVQFRKCFDGYPWPYRAFDNQNKK